MGNYGSFREKVKVGMQCRHGGKSTKLGGGGSCNWSIYKKVFASTYQDQKLGFADANDPLAPHPNPGSKCPPCPQLVPPALHYAQAFTTSI